MSRLLAIMALALCALPAHAQQAPPQQPPAHQPQARTSWGAPDLQGYWSNKSLTALERPEGTSQLVMTAEEAVHMARGNMLVRAKQGDARQSVVTDEASDRLLADRNTSRAHNQFWNDMGSSYALVKGEYRTSWIVEPTDGRTPWSDAGRKASLRTRTFDGPEGRPQSERCLMSFTGSAGPIMNNGLYNNTYQIVQTPGSVVVFTEMIHDVRIIPISEAGGGKHGPAGIPKWGGDSIGWYEDDTLVVETVNVHPQQRSYISPAGKLTERFSRWSDGQILYRFTIEDLSLYSRPWSGEMSLNASKSSPFEYGCHEGNYALQHILQGARQMERDGRPRQPIQEPYPGVDVSEGQ
ncbi:MAG TPA: hypothetical protein VGO52_24430 [Hyphomonadaceae bacterium]|jgi:hypothetical protein|nr:hypothetical protein [Hyphomonadaceae bacterium]